MSSSGPSAPAEDFLLPAEHVEVSAPVADLLKDYKDNELRGDAKYKAKRVRITGKAGDIKRDLTNTIFVTVGTGARFELPEAQCFFDNDYASEVMNLSHGADLTVDGTVAGLMGNVLLKDCAFPKLPSMTICRKLVSAGVAKVCLNSDERFEQTGFAILPVPSDTSQAKLNDWTSKAVGIVMVVRDDASYPRMIAKLDRPVPDSNIDTHRHVGSPAARAIVSLPATASPAIEAKTKAVLDGLTTRE